MERDNPLQLDFVGKVKNLTIDWARGLNIKLHTIETVVPFVTTDKGLSVWLFFETERLRKKYKKDGTVDSVKEKYLAFLKELNYPLDYCGHVSFTIDSYENVVKNFEGSYFYRLR